MSSQNVGSRPQDLGSRGFSELHAFLSNYETLPWPDAITCFFSTRKEFNLPWSSVVIHGLLWSTSKEFGEDFLRVGDMKNREIRDRTLFSIQQVRISLRELEAKGLILREGKGDDRRIFAYHPWRAMQRRLNA